MYEAAGLRWLSQVGADGASVVEVVHASDRQLTLPRLVPAPATVEAAQDLGRRLAVTHDAGAGAFGAGPAGWSGDGWIGTAPMSLEPCPSWGAFYAEQRCLPYARRAYDRGTLDADALTVVENACARIGQGMYDDDAPPARIHGDLWSGNVIATGTGFVLIDPAAHGGHRITDLAMLSLFDAPHLDRILSAYESASSHLPRHWRSLLPLHQLHPLLVHAALFGGPYGPHAAEVASHYL
jgi:fructosamine-3-kinase